MFYIIVGTITFIALILLIIAIYYNKFQFAIIKIDEAENNADLFLHKKLELIKRAIPIIEEELKLKDFLKDIIDIKEEEINHFELNSKLSDSYKELFKKIDDNEKLYKSEALLNIINELNDNEIELIGTIKYYNDTVVDFNKLILSFPSNIIRLFFGYKKKEFYSHEKYEMFEILKDDKTNEN